MSLHHESNGHADENNMPQGNGNSPACQGNSDQDLKAAVQTQQTSPATPNASVAKKTRRAKKPRRGKNTPEPNYSAMVQEQMSSTNRTGQACDRCKGRKMKCDSNPTGCANCIASDSVCTQTDPITKVSSIRGELERLRQENAALRCENEELRQALNRSNELLRRYQMGNGHSGVLGILLQGQRFGQAQGNSSYRNGGTAVGPAGQAVTAAPFQTTQNNYDSIQDTRGFSSDVFANNALVLPPLVQHPQNRPGYVNGFTVVQTGTNNRGNSTPTSGGDIPGPSQAAQQPQAIEFNQQAQSHVTGNGDYKGYPFSS
ncbi:hypothetical protein VTO42DRAFT_4525 [Malbranchea cinnamomea]